MKLSTDHGSAATSCLGVDVAQPSPEVPARLDVPPDHVAQVGPLDLRDDRSRVVHHSEVQHRLRDRALTSTILISSETLERVRPTPRWSGQSR
jgi:hypothetical protein